MTIHTKPVVALDREAARPAIGTATGRFNRAAARLPTT